jgi:stearoyl-CoA desaturase (delta-9 desaturase)
MKMFESNSETLNKIQSFTFLSVIAGFFYFDFTILNIGLTVISFYVYSIFGLSMTMHRYYTHKSFEMHPILHWIFTFIAILTGRGSPLGWVYIHRLHHAFSDSNKDPHGPAATGFKLFGFKPIESKTKPNLFIVKELMTPPQLFITKYYLLIIISWLLVLGLINLDLIYFTWFLPVFCVQLSQNCFNHFAHTSGYRNFNTKDNSTNNIWLWPFILGDAWHNNHHANAEKTTTKVQRFEFDPVSAFINLIKK